MFVLSRKTRVPIVSWLPHHEIDGGTMDQLVNAANHPDVVDHVASMPDAHLGYGIPIGSIVATGYAVIPNAVGVDIGCGVSAFQTHVPYDVERMDQSFWDDWANLVLKHVPVGFNSHEEAQPLIQIELKAKELRPLMESKAPYQMGTLGGGNHFMEALIDESDEIWLMVHSGSRNIGGRIAQHYHAIAKEQFEKQKIKGFNDLASLAHDDDAYHNYFNDMHWAMLYAEASRHEMLKQMRNALSICANMYVDNVFINCTHNFAEYDNKFRAVVHRKGATTHESGKVGLIPGSMGTQSYVVEVQRNRNSFDSCSHGAGRALARGKAKEILNMEDFEQAVSSTYSQVSRGILDESPMAYKDITQVMERQAGLVRIVHELSPLMTLKGDSRAKDD